MLQVRVVSVWWNLVFWYGTCRC